jgi:hypothetical protein
LATTPFVAAPVAVGLYTLLARPVDSNAWAKREAGRASELTMSKVSTSDGFEETQLETWER